MNLNKTLLKEKTRNRIEEIKSRIEYCEDCINEIIFDLYGLTQDEIQSIDE